jgi:hypothetical protein
MFAKFVQFVEDVAGRVLGGIAVSVQFGNVLICIFLLWFGPTLVLAWMPR